MDHSTQIEAVSGGHPSSSRVAVLGTLIEFHPEALPHNLEHLTRLVTSLNPDLLCLDIAPEQWHSKDFARLPTAYKQALLPLALASDIVVVPIGHSGEAGAYSATGWRGWLISILRQLLSPLQQTAPDLEAINQGWRHDLANLIYHGMVFLANPDTVADQNEHLRTLTENVLAAAERNPGSRILVVVNVQYCHLLRPELRKISGIDVTGHHHL